MKSEVIDLDRGIILTERSSKEKYWGPNKITDKFTQWLKNKWGKVTIVIDLASLSWLLQSVKLALHMYLILKFPISDKCPCIILMILCLHTFIPGNLSLLFCCLWPNSFTKQMVLTLRQITVWLALFVSSYYFNLFPEWISGPDDVCV